MEYDDLVETREKTYQKLTTEQREFLDNHVRRGKRTVWLNVLAKHKGAHLTPEELEEYETYAQRYLDWELLDRIDHGERTGKVRCMCGMPLRYEYIVVNHKTAETVTLGQTCLHNHLELPINIVTQVVKGVREIDLERDEILDKITSKWKLRYSIDGIEIPEQIKKQLDIGLPLLQRQEIKLRELFFMQRQKQLKEERREAIIRQRQIHQQNQEQWQFHQQQQTTNYYKGQNLEYMPSNEPYRNLFSYVKQPQRRSINSAFDEPLPSANELSMDSMMYIISMIIKNEFNTTATKRLIQGLLYAKMHPEKFSNDIFVEARDAAEVALGFTEDQLNRKWLEELKKL